YCHGTPPPWNSDFHSAHRNFSSGRMDSRFPRAFSRLFIGNLKPTPHTPHLLASPGMISWKYGLSEASHTKPARPPSGAITNALLLRRAPLPKSVILQRGKPSAVTSRTTKPKYTGAPSGRAMKAGSVCEALRAV